MSMKTTSIEWTEKVWDCMTGCRMNCLNNEGKPYCYTYRFLKDREPKFYPQRLNEPIKEKSPSIIFVANKGDLFGETIPFDWILKVFEVMHKCPQHIFQTLTKNPWKYLDLPTIYSVDGRNYESIFADNIWVGTSVTRQSETWRIEVLKKVKCKVKFISFEPLLDFINYDLLGISWAIVGAESIFRADNPKYIYSAKKFAEPLIESILAQKIPLFTKPNLRWNPEYKEMPPEFYEWKDRR